MNIPESVEKLEFYAFDGCSSLTSITIPKNVTSILGNPFEGCQSLERIDVDAENTKYISIDSGSVA